MSDASLSIKIGADVQNAIGGIQKLNSSLDVTKLNIEQTAAYLDRLSVSLERTSDPAISAGIEKTMESLENHLRDLQQKANSTATALNTIPPALSNISVSSDGVLNSLAKQRVAFQDVGRIVTGEGFSLQALSRNFTLFNPAVIIAAAALAFFGEQIIQFIGKASDAELAAKKLNETIADSSASPQGEIAELRDLTGVILDETNARGLREKAFAKLQDEYPNAFKNMSLEKTSLEEIKAATDKVTDALVRQAEIKGLESAITDVYKSIAEESVKASSQVTSATDKISIALAELESGAFIFHPVKSFTDVQDTVAGQEKQTNIKTYQAQIDALNGKLKDLLSTSLKLDDDTLLGGKTKVANDNSSEINKSIVDQIKAAQTELDKISTEPLFKQFEQTLGAQGQDAVAVLQAQIVEVIKKSNEGIKAALAAGNPNVASAIKSNRDKLIGLINNEIDQKNNPNLTAHINFDLVPQIDDSKIIKAAQEEADKLQSELDKIQVQTAKINLQSFVNIGGQEDSSKGVQLQENILNAEEKQQKDYAVKTLKDNVDLQEAILAITVEYAAKRKLVENKAGDDATKSINQAIQNLQKGGLENLGEAIGTAIGKGKDPIQAAGEAIVSSLGDMIEKIGKALIEYGVLKSGLDTIFENPLTIPGGVAIALGVGAIAIGALLKAVASSGKGLATGGVVEGPGTGTSDSVHTRLSKGEFVVKAAAATKPDNLALLHSINKGETSGAEISNLVVNSKGALEDKSLAINNIISHAAGGIITGPGTGKSDSILARLSNREFVVNAAAVQKPGNLSLLHSINNGQTQGFATGGLVGNSLGVSMPNSNLNSFVQNNVGSLEAIQVTGDFKLKGNDLSLAIARNTKNQNLVS